MCVGKVSTMANSLRLAAPLSIVALICLAIAIYSSAPFLTFLLERNTLDLWAQTVPRVANIWSLASLCYAVLAVGGYWTPKASRLRKPLPILFGMLLGVGVSIVAIERTGLRMLTSRHVIVVGEEGQCRRALAIVRTSHPGCFCGARKSGGTQLHFPIVARGALEDSITELSHKGVVARMPN